MNKPYTVCQMVISIDGKVVGGFDMRSDLYPAAETCMKKGKEQKFDALVAGRVTMNAFNAPEPIDYSKYQGKKIERTDYAANTSHGYYIVAIDPNGKIQWPFSITASEFEALGNAHVITALSESVSDEYLAYLQDIGVSYIFGGKVHDLSMKIVSEKLMTLFGIKKMCVAGGPTVLGAFAKEGLFDELNLTVAPLTAPDLPRMQLFEGTGISPVLYNLETVEEYDKGILWLQYKKNDLVY